MPQRVADYFVVAGFNPENAKSLRLPGEAQKRVDPICDICILNAHEDERVPEGYTLLNRTIGDAPADLNHGSFNAPCMYLCYRRGKDKVPIVGFDIVTSPDEKGEVVTKTPYSRSANVNNGTSFGAVPLYVRVKRDAYSSYVLTDIAVVLPSKGEEDPIGFQRLNENLNRGMVGSDVFLSLKLSPKSVNRASFRAELLSRLPKQDHEDIPLEPVSTSVPIFALPSGTCLESWDRDIVGAINSQPEFSTFVLTTETSEKIYGASLAFLERFDNSKLSDLIKRRLNIHAGNNEPLPDAEKRETYVSKAICLLSRHPFFDAFEAFLKFLYQMTVSNSVHNISIERHISQFMSLPFPSPRCPRIHAHLSVHHQIFLSLPRYRPLPPSGASFSALLWHLGSERVISLFHAVLAQQRICLHSLHLAELTPAVEAVAGLIFPLQWHCPFIPLCPIELASIIESPTPLLMGLSTTYFECPDNIPDPNSVYLVSLDQGPLPDQTKKFKLFPSKVLNPLLSRVKEIERRLRTVGRKQGFGLDDPEDDGVRESIELDLRQAFIRFMCHILNRYRDHLLPIRQRPSTGATDLKMLFNVDGFVKRNAQNSKTSQTFYKLLTSSQAFCSFIESRTFSSGQVDIQQHEFFDQCQETVDRQIESELIQAGTPNEEDTMKIVPPPEVEGDFTYGEFPTDLRDLVRNDTTRHEKCEGSPGQRTPQELKRALEIAQTYYFNDELWPFLLKSYYYALYFLYLPTYTETAVSVTSAFREGIKVMEAMGTQRITLPDEAPLRMLLSSCLNHEKPMTAVRVLNVARKSLQLPINAATYALYNQVLLEAKWPAKNRDGYTLWRLVRNTILGITAFMEPIKSYRKFQAPPLQATWNLQMGLKHEVSVPQSGRTCSRSMEGGFEIDQKLAKPSTTPLIEQEDSKESNEPESSTDPVETLSEEVFEPRSLTTQKSTSSIIKNSVSEGDVEAEQVEGAPTPQPNVKPVPNELALEAETPFIPSRHHGLPLPTTPVKSRSDLNLDSLSAKSIDDLSTPFSSPSTPTQSATPPLIPAYPRGQAVTPRSTWSLPKSMSDISLSKLAISERLKQSPSFKINVLSPSMKNSLRSMTDSVSSLTEQVKQSPSISNIRDRTNQYLSTAGKEIDKMTTSVNKSLAQYYDSNGDHQDPPSEVSSEDSLNMEDEKKTRSRSLPRPARPTSLDRLSIPSDATGSIKSGQLITPDLCVIISPACHCLSCHRPLYEEEIMAGWSHNSSCMLTRCPWCNKGTTPYLSITIEDRRGKLKVLQLTHAFLSPIVMRKEMENLLILQGEKILRDSSFVDSHATLYWNVLYAFQRIGVRHTLDQLLPISSLLMGVDPTDDDSGSHSLKDNKSNVQVRLSWDSELANESMLVPPMYLVYKEYQKDEKDRQLDMLKYPFELLQTIVEAIKTNDCDAPLLKLLHQFNTATSGMEGDVAIRRSCYREALFLLISAVGQGNIEFPLFDAYWAKAHSRLPSHAAQLKAVNDKTPAQRTFNVRQKFGELPLLY